MKKLQVASVTVFALSALTLAAQCSGMDGGTAGKPFRAEYHCRDTQTLANGTQIVQEHSGVEARDGQGRTYVESSPIAANSPVSITVNDSAHGTMAVWQAMSSNEASEAQTESNVQFHKVVKVIRFAPAAVRQPTAVEEHARLESTMCPKEEREGLTCEDLGTRTVAGLVAHGIIERRTVPAGEAGNDAPFVVTYERWYSPELNLMVAGTTNDPRNGEHSMTLDNIVRAEPPASLFELPEGYAVQEQPQ